MANNFRILSHRTSENLHLKLTGCFDGNSALELISVLKKNDDFYSVFINTNDLGKVYSFGREVLRKNLSEIDALKPYVVFIGQNIGQSLN